MKKFTIILAMTLPFDSVMGGRHTPVSILNMTSSIIYLKVHKHYIGATIEIQDDHGVKLVEEQLKNKKVIVDFYYKKAGTYLIKIKKGHAEQQFKFDHLDDHEKTVTVSDSTAAPVIEAPIEGQLARHDDETDKILIVQ